MTRFSLSRSLLARLKLQVFCLGDPKCSGLLSGVGISRNPLPQVASAITETRSHQGNQNLEILAGKFQTFLKLSGEISNFPARNLAGKFAGKFAKFARTEVWAGYRTDQTTSVSPEVVSESIIFRLYRLRCNMIISNWIFTDKTKRDNRM